MKFTVEQKDIAAAMTSIAATIERSGTIPILKNARLEARKARGGSGTLSLTGTDMDKALSLDIDADVSAAGAATAPAHMLLDLVGGIDPGAQIGFEYSVESSRMRVRAGRASWALATLPADDFPNLKHSDFSCEFDMPADALRDLLSRTAFAMSGEETRFYLNGIYLHVADLNGAEPQALRAVATDSHRLAHASVDLPEGAAEMPGVIVPRDTVLLVDRLLKTAGETVRLQMSDTRIGLKIGSAQLVSKLVDGQFPDYTRVIPPVGKIKAEIPVAAMKAALKRVLIVNANKERRVTWSIDKGSVTAIVEDPERGSAEESVDADVAGGSLRIGMNAFYAMSILERIAGANSVWSFSDSQSPIRIDDPEDAGARFVVMPLRT